MPSETKALTPPYISVLQLKNFVKQLAETSVPIKIDKGVIGSLSGSAQTALMSAIRFLGLVSDDGTTQKALRDLVDAYKAGEGSWKQGLLSRLNAAYKDVVVNVDIENGTWKTLEKAFIDAGVREGQMSEKSTRFYVAAMVEAGAKVSHYITKAKGRTTGSGTKATKRRENKPTLGKSSAGASGDSGDGDRGDEDYRPEGLINHYVPLPGRPSGSLIRCPTDVSEEEIALFEHSLAFLRLYAKHRAMQEEGRAE